jgi:hypothetical protein
VPDVKLGHLNEPSDRGDIAVIEAVSGVQFQPRGNDTLGRRAQGVQLEQPWLPFWAIGVAPGVQFDSVHAQAERRLDLHRLGIKKQRDLDPGGPAPVHGFGNPALMRNDVEAAFSRQLLTPFGNEGDLIGTHLHGQGDNRRIGGELEVKPHLHGLAEQPQVAVLDMPAILSQVNGNPVSTTKLCKGGSPHWVWLQSASRLPESRNVIDIHTQAQHDCLPVS